jgi:dTDP-4-dehydrorhamnose 3,5-epimerase
MPLLPEIAETELSGAYDIASRVFPDDRGLFLESWSAATWPEAGLGVTFRQDNISVSKKGVLRGMHYQIEPHGMGKLIRVISGAVFDVGVDLRKGSPTFGRWIGRELRANDGRALYLPPSFAHGFLALEDDTTVYYKCTTTYAPEAERAFVWNDPVVGIAWPMEPTTISDKDRAAPAFEDAEHNFVFEG